MKILPVGLSPLLAVSAAGSTDPIPIETEFQVNTLTVGPQDGSDVVVTGSGDFIVVFQSYESTGSDDAGFSIQARRFTADGAPVGEEFQVNSVTAGWQLWPAISVGPDDEFVVTWSSDVAPADGFLSIQAQRFAADGDPIGTEFTVNTYTTNGQHEPDVAFNRDGNFLVTWHSFESDGLDTSGTSVHAQIYDAVGAPGGDEFEVNSWTPNNQGYARVEADPLGDFWVVWQSYSSIGSDQQGHSVQGQRVSAAGTLTGDQFQVNTYSTLDQYLPDIAVDSAGDFVVVWQSREQDGDGLGIFGQMFSAGGAPRGGEFQVNSFSTNRQSYPEVAADGRNGFVVAWDSLGQDGSDYGIFGRRIGRDGVVQGMDFQVNEHTSGKQYNPSIDIGGGGRFVVTWGSYTSTGSDQDETSTQARRFLTDVEVFADDFESGDFSNWDSVFPPPGP